MRLFHDLLVLHGHVADPRTLRGLAGVDGPARDRAAPAPVAAGPAGKLPRVQSRPNAPRCAVPAPDPLDPPLA